MRRDQWDRYRAAFPRRARSRARKDRWRDIVARLGRSDADLGGARRIDTADRFRMCVCCQVIYSAGVDQDPRRCPACR